MIENLDEGVEIAAMTDHDNITSYGPAIASLGAWDRITSLDGDEVSINGKGHFNMFEPTGDAEALYPFIGSKFYSGKTVPQVFEAIRAIEGVRVIQMNHPRSFDAYLSWIKYDPVTGNVNSSQANMAWDFDSIEVKDSVGSPGLFTAQSDPDIQSQAKYGSKDIPVMRDWFSMLNQGMPVCAMGNSDAHNRNDGVGYSRNFLRLGTDMPSQATTTDILDAILAQRNVVSNGPFLRIMVDDPAGPGLIERMGHDEMVEPDEGEVVVDVTVSAATWVNVSRLEVYANGRPVHLKEVLGVLLEDEMAGDTDPLWVPIPLPNTTPGDVERLHTTVHLYPEADTWYVFLVRGAGDLAPVGNGAPFAYTNPLYVDVEGDGTFNAPGL
ncbi:MAG: CehA/McbA family metallohydrolase [Deltaproteobacteria bacterium]|nr:CehA/McbA family metallohydrolase [Deltaproteobacteria bacterium]